MTWCGLKNAMIPFKQWLTEEAARTGISVSGVRQRVYSGKYTIKFKKKNQRVIMVVKARLNWTGKTLKEFCCDEAIRLGTTPRAIEMRVRRGKHRAPKLLRYHKT
jgi:hypothetical protein